MSDDLQKLPGDTTTPDPSGEDDAPLAERVGPGDWEIVLAEAAPPPPPVPSAPTPTRNWALWLRAALPVLVLVVYGVYKFTDRDRNPPGASERDAVPASLTGVQPDREKVTLDRQTRDFVAGLETLRLADDWRGVRDAIAAADPPALRENAVVLALDTVARVRLGETSGTLLGTIDSLKPVFRSDKERRGLYEALLLAEARLFLDATRSPEACAKYADDFRDALLAQSTNSADVVDLRVRLAERYESVAGKLVEDAGRIRVDRVKLAEARSLYQNALRWVTTQDGWLQLQPVSAGKPAIVAGRLRLELQTANKRYHGRSMPFGDSDSTTWTGRKGDPIHDHAGGKW
jgi:hypothetical protein